MLTSQHELFGRFLCFESYLLIWFASNPSINSCSWLSSKTWIESFEAFCKEDTIVVRFLGGNLPDHELLLHTRYGLKTGQSWWHPPLRQNILECTTWPINQNKTVMVLVEAPYLKVKKLQRKCGGLVAHIATAAKTGNFQATKYKLYNHHLTTWLWMDSTLRAKSAIL